MSLRVLLSYTAVLRLSGKMVFHLLGIYFLVVKAAGA